MSDDEFGDDHIDFDDGGDGGFEDFEGGGATLGDMWRNNPLVKIGVIAGGLITVIGAIILFGGSDEAALRSQMRAGDTGKEAPGGELSQVMKEAVEESNEQRTDEAARTGGSAIPTPIGGSAERIKLPEDEEAGEDPLERWRRIQEERQRQVVQRPPEITGDPNAEAIDALANAMAAQMEGILGAQEPLEPLYAEITPQEWLDGKRQEELEAIANTQAAANESATGNGDVVNILIPAGEIEYAQLITEANSDVPGPVLAKLASGPLAGAKLLGSFKVEDEYLVLSFDTIVIDGISHSTEAVAVDPDTTLVGMATEVDHRYFDRVILPAAAAFVEGIGEAIGETNQTTVVVDGGAAVSSEEELDTQQEFFKGFEAAAERVGEILDENADETQILIRVESGTPMGILFVDPVTDETS